MRYRRFREQRSVFLRGIADDMSRERRVPVVGEDTQLAETSSKVMDAILVAKPVTDLLGEGIVPTSSLYLVYVYREGGGPFMILTHVDPFHYEHVSLSELEMQVIISWSKEMYMKKIGTFAPSDGGWFWWRK